MGRLTLSDFPIQLEFPVHWGDMDSAGHVNNLVYLRWTETARVAYFKAVGIDTSFAGEGIGAILAWHDCKYTFPVTFPDEVIVGVRTLELLDDRLHVQAAVFSKRHDRLAAFSSQHIVPYNYAELKKVGLPEEWKQEAGKFY